MHRVQLRLALHLLFPLVPPPPHPPPVPSSAFSCRACPRHLNLHTSEVFCRSRECMKHAPAERVSRKVDNLIFPANYTVVLHAGRHSYIAHRTTRAASSESTGCREERRERGAQTSCRRPELVFDNRKTSWKFRVIFCSFPTRGSFWRKVLYGKTEEDKYTSRSTYSSDFIRRRVFPSDSTFLER